MASYELLYVVPAGKVNKGKNPVCLALRKGNREPQKQYQSAESYMAIWQEELENETKRKAEVTSLYQTKNGGRGKVYILPNGQILIPVPILEGKGNSTGYVSLKDVTAICQGYDGNGILRFFDKDISLSTHMAAHSLFTRVNHAKSNYCEGYKPSDLIWEILTEKEKVQCALSQPADLRSDILQTGKSLTLATLDFLRQVPVEKLPEVIGDLCRKMGRVDGYWRDKKMDWLRAYVYTMVGHMATKEDVKKALALADHPETIPMENPTEIGQTYWSASCDIQAEPSDSDSDDTVDDRKLIYATSYADVVRTVTANPTVTALDKTQSALRNISGVASVMEEVQSRAQSALSTVHGISAAMEAAQQQARFMDQQMQIYRNINALRTIANALPGVAVATDPIEKRLTSLQSVLGNLGRVSPMSRQIPSQYNIFEITQEKRKGLAKIDPTADRLIDRLFQKKMIKE